MLKPLIIDHDYRIVNSASGQIARTFWESQPNNRFQTSIICCKTDSDLKSKLNVIQISDRPWIRHIGGLFREIGIPDFCHIPDQRYYSWLPFILYNREIDSLSSSCDYLHSISCPDSSHLVAYKLKKRYGKKWIAQFNDPWIGNETKRYKFSRFRKYDESLERLVAENADLIIHTNRIMMEDWMNRYDHSILNKMVEIPLSFNISNLPLVTSMDPIMDKLIIYHIGHLYGARSAKTIFDALSRLFAQYPNYREKVELNFIGGVTDDDKKYATSLNLGECVHFWGTMKPEELEPHYRRANMFLVIDMNIERSPSFPSKLMLYHYYQRPIISLTTSGSIIEDDMIASGHHYFYYGHSNEVTKFLGDVIRGEIDLSHFNHEYWKRYSVENVCHQYLENVQKILH